MCFRRERDMSLRDARKEFVSYRNFCKKLYRICPKTNISRLRSKHITKTSLTYLMQVLERFFCYRKVFRRTLPICKGGFLLCLNYLLVTMMLVASNAPTFSSPAAKIISPSARFANLIIAAFEPARMDVLSFTKICFVTISPVRFYHKQYNLRKIKVLHLHMQYHSHTSQHNQFQSCHVYP